MFVLPYAKVILGFIISVLSIYCFFIRTINTYIKSEKGETIHIIMGFMCIFLGVLIKKL